MGLVSKKSQAAIGEIGFKRSHGVRSPLIIFCKSKGNEDYEDIFGGDQTPNLDELHSMTAVGM